MDLIMILLGFLISCIPLAITCLYLLSLVTPWPVRTRKDLLQPMFAYTPPNPGSEQFRSLLIHDDETSGEFHCTKPDLYLSVIIPAMNEQERLPIMLNECLPYLEERQIKDDSFTYEIIVVDDGSTDETADIGYWYTEKYEGKVRVLKLEKNIGKGGAVRRGVLYARGSLILFADADGATKFADFQHLEEELLSLVALDGCVSKRRANFDWIIPAIAIGSRSHMEKKSIATRSLARTFLMIGFHLIVYIFAVRTVRDTQCGFKLFTRGAVSKLFPLLHIERWAFDVELLFLAEQFNIPVREVPVTWHEVDGSKIVPIISWIQMGRDLMLIWFRYVTGIIAGLGFNKPDRDRTMAGSPKKSRRKSERNTESKLVMEVERVLNTYDTDSDFGKNAIQWDVTTYISKIEIFIVNESEDGMALEFDLVGVEAPIANAIRRVLIAELPTMAIEKVYLYQNTSIIPDEVLSHRLGLLPIKADPRLFEMPLTRVAGMDKSGVDCNEEPAGDPKRNLIFEIKITCSRNSNALKTATNPKEVYENAFVYSNAFKWIPIGDQSVSLPYSPTMVHDDILVAQLRPGQEIEARCHCLKGLGRDHAKFSPVATASYRLLPQIVLKKKFSGTDAQRIKSSFSEGVIEIDADGVAVVRDARCDTCSRNILRHEDLAEHIELSRIKDHFIFSVESTGALRSAELVVEACKVMEEKCRAMRSLFQKRLKEVQ
uniref:DNA-directed RNA polymerases I and III subunit RPAC1 n=1 Tax=Onchocerca volvulus TaxID=6282 RepID=A0A8R1Y062_ONCVO